MPKRIQRSRQKGWRKPEGAVIVDRTSQWGNDFVIGKDGTREECLLKYREHFIKPTFQVHGTAYFEPLRGKDLVCWCALDQACHADVLLQLANEEEPCP